jgi:predicted TIM-barrel fold metal-dependent hydrolase
MREVPTKDAEGVKENVIIIQATICIAYLVAIRRQYLHKEVTMQRKIFDCHMHTLSGTPEKLQAIADHFGFEKYAVLGCPCFAGELNNLHVLLAKALHPDHVYAFGGLTYGPDERSGEAHVMQVRRLLEAGFDGIKFIESKPGLARDLKVQMDSDELEPVFSLLEEEQVPVLWHVGDPATFWNEKLAPAFADANGWLYTDPSFPTLETLYAQTERVLSRHPQLKVCLAHFYFTADDIGYARHMMDTYPGLRFDLTPGTEMYGHFLHEPEMWRKFFIAYQNRILFGTDITDDETDFQSGLYDTLVGLMESSLTQPGTVAVWDIQGRGLNLPQTVLYKIFVKNAERFNGETPRPIFMEGAVCLLKWHEENISPALRPLLDEIKAKLHAVLYE